MTGSFQLSERALQYLKEAAYPKGKADALKCYGFALLRLSKNDEAYKCLSEALTIYDSLADIKGIGTINEYFGIRATQLGKFCCFA